MPDLISRPYHPNPDKACEACIFGTASHAEWCEKAPILSLDLGIDQMSACLIIDSDGMIVSEAITAPKHS